MAIMVMVTANSATNQYIIDLIVIMMSQIKATQSRNQTYVIVIIINDTVKLPNQAIKYTCAQMVLFVVMVTALIPIEAFQLELMINRCQSHDHITSHHIRHRHININIHIPRNTINK
jgi:hypothetical protein